MEKAYDHHLFENDIYSRWEKSGAFTPSDKNKAAFTIIMPPPNANADLHVGHARFITIEDVLTRYWRMMGKPTLWLPGADHAGIETQFVFEKKLKTEGKSRFFYDRNQLYSLIWDYVQSNKGNMEKQLKSLGASCDWTRNRFTLDKDVVAVVSKTFKKLYDDGLVYRGDRIVNYCPRCGTAYSQLEVDTVEREDDLYYLDYQTIQIATTRPETIFADVAVAVNPNDSRYQKLVGKTARIPIINRDIPIVADSLVDPDFGTGALKITPGHDAVDFEIGQKHALPTILVIDESGRMINTPKDFIGLKVDEARSRTTDVLRRSNKLIKIEKINHVVGICYKDKGLIEPRPFQQWFVKVKPLAKAALRAIKSGGVKFVQKRYEKMATHWLSNLKDWNISRQIVWGIQIPAWYCSKCRNWTITDGATPQKCSGCHCKKLTRDSDTFDTWFSSGQWPFATLVTNGKQSKKNSKLNIGIAATEDFDRFYPTSVMETAYDIIPFWVIRMIMLGLYATGKVPFKEVLIHGLVRDKSGQKISKSKGNVINPLEMTEKYGADALRMGLLWGASVGNDISLSEDNIRGQRNFSNKIWNIARFIEIAGAKALPKKPVAVSAENKKVLKKLNQTTASVSKNLQKYQLNKAAEEVYDFIWHYLADNFLENIKIKDGPKTTVKKSAVLTLNYVFCQSLKLLHPFMPFITEVLYQQLYANNQNDLVINSSWPELS